MEHVGNLFMGAAGLGIGLLTFLWKVIGDSRRQKDEECRQCFQERDLLRIENRKLERQNYELMLELLQEEH